VALLVSVPAARGTGEPPLPRSPGAQAPEWRVLSKGFLARTNRPTLRASSVGQNYGNPRVRSRELVQEAIPLAISPKRDSTFTMKPDTLRWKRPARHRSHRTARLAWSLCLAHLVFAQAADAAV